MIIVHRAVNITEILTLNIVTDPRNEASSLHIPTPSRHTGMKVNTHISYKYILVYRHTYI